MKLTGKAKEGFLEFIHINEDRFQNYNFYKLDESMQNALIIEWFDSVGIYISTGYVCGDYKFSLKNEIKEPKFQEAYNYESLQEATEKAIEHANLIYNERN